MSRQSIRFRFSGPSLTSGTMRSRYRRHAEAKGLDRKEQKGRRVTIHPPRLVVEPSLRSPYPEGRGGQGVRTTPPSASHHHPPAACEPPNTSVAARPHHSILDHRLRAE